MGGNISLMVQHGIMMLTQGMCLVHCCCSRWMFMILWGVPQQCHCLPNTFPPHMRSLCVILQTGSSWISFYSLQDHLIFNILLWLLTVTLPCRAGGQLADIPWQTEVPGKCQFPSSAKIALEGWRTMNWKVQRITARTCRAAAKAVLCFCLCIKGCFSLSSSPKNLCSAARLNPCAVFLCEKTGTDQASRETEDYPEAVSQLAQATVVDAGWIQVSSSVLTARTAVLV